MLLSIGSQWPIEADLFSPPWGSQKLPRSLWVTSWTMEIFVRGLYFPELAWLESAKCLWVFCLCWDLSGPKSILKFKVPHTLSEAWVTSHNCWELPFVKFWLGMCTIVPIQRAICLRTKLPLSFCLICHQGQNPLEQKPKSLSQPARIKSQLPNCKNKSCRLMQVSTKTNTSNNKVQGLNLEDLIPLKTSTVCISLPEILRLNYFSKLMS